MSNRQRIQAFNTVAQYDSKIAVRTSQAARSDNAAMKTISLLTLTFLPATFLCALFSTSFFDFTPANQGQPAKWSISSKMWIYWAIVLPLTITTVTSWMLWQRKFPVQGLND